MIIPYTFSLDETGDDDNQWRGWNRIPLSLELDVTLGNKYLYGADADGNRGEERQDIDDVKLVCINYLLNCVPQNLQDHIQEWFKEHYTLSDWIALIEKEAGFEE